MFYWSNVVIFSVFCISKNGDLWKITMLEKCNRSNIIIVFNDIFDVTTDIVFFALSFSIILKLQFEKKKRDCVSCFCWNFCEYWKCQKNYFLLICPKWNHRERVFFFYRIKFFHERNLLWFDIKLAIVT